MKVAFLRFNHPDTERTYRDELRARMYAAGYEPHQVTDLFRTWFLPKKLTGYVAGTADADRAADVASEFRGVVCKLRNEP
jgi:hypothetical protein